MGALHYAQSSGIIFHLNCGHRNQDIWSGILLPDNCCCDGCTMNESASLSSGPPTNKSMSVGASRKILQIKLEYTTDEVRSCPTNMLNMLLKGLCADNVIFCHSHPHLYHQENLLAIIVGCAVYNWAANCDAVVRTATQLESVAHILCQALLI